MENGFSNEEYIRNPNYQPHDHHDQQPHHTEHVRPRTIDPVVEKLVYPESKTEYIVDRLISGVLIGVGFVIVTKGAPYLMAKLDAKNRAARM